MKKIILVLGICFVFFHSYGQPAGLTDEIWYLRYIVIDGEQQFAPLGEDVDLSFFEDNGTLIALSVSRHGKIYDGIDVGSKEDTKINCFNFLMVNEKMPKYVWGMCKFLILGQMCEGSALYALNKDIISHLVHWCKVLFLSFKDKI